MIPWRIAQKCGGAAASVVRTKNICRAGGIRTPTGRHLKPLPLPLGYGPARYSLIVRPLTALTLPFCARQGRFEVDF